jgi:hypothetical protein
MGAILDSGQGGKNAYYQIKQDRWLHQWFNKEDTQVMGVEGTLVNIELREEVYKDNSKWVWCLIFEDENEVPPEGEKKTKHILKLNERTFLCRNLLSRFGNIADSFGLGGIIQVVIGRADDDNSWLRVNFNDEKIECKWQYNKDEKTFETFPVIEPIKNKKGAIVDWDMDDHLDKWRDVVFDEIGPALLGLSDPMPRGNHVFPHGDLSDVAKKVAARAGLNNSGEKLDVDGHEQTWKKVCEYMKKENMSTAEREYIQDAWNKSYKECTKNTATTLFLTGEAGIEGSQEDPDDDLPF